MKADLHEIFDTASLLLESLGFPIFKPLVHKAATGELEEENEIWQIKGPSADATGVFSSDGFIVLAGSKARSEFTPGSAESGFARKRERMIEDGILKPDGDSYTFTEDVLFNSPSGSAAIILARHTNGWRDWKDSQGRTLDEVNGAVKLNHISFWNKPNLNVFKLLRFGIKLPCGMSN